jgi:hypothetical protein
MPGIPWPAIEKYPSIYIDNTILPNGFKLREPSRMSVPEVWTLVSHIQELQSRNPAQTFHFRSRNDIARHLESPLVRTINTSTVVSEVGTLTDAGIVGTSVADVSAAHGETSVNHSTTTTNAADRSPVRSENLLDKAMADTSAVDVSPVHRETQADKGMADTSGADASVADVDMGTVIEASTVPRKRARLTIEIPVAPKRSRNR